VFCAIREIRRPSPLAPLMLFAFATIAMGLGLTAGVEFWTLNGDIGRMNTVFKFYLHTWELWGIAAAYGAWLVFDVMRPHQALLTHVRRADPAAIAQQLTVPVRLPAAWWMRGWRYAFAAIGVVLIALTLVYPYFGTLARNANRFDNASTPHYRGNDGLAWLDEVETYDNTGQPSGGGPHELRYTRDALTWVRQNIKGTPTTIEGIGDRYRSISSRFSIYAGLPTVAAWEFHQLQQRTTFEATVRTRQADVREFYTTTDVARARAIIAKYGVEYVFVGDEENFIYPEDGLEKFKGGLGGVLELSYENPAIQIWHVIPEDELPAASASAR
jgi:uncharacterized membrane protein